MPPSDDLLRTLWQAIEHAGDLERELRTTAEALAAWQQIARAALAALDREIRDAREKDSARQIGTGGGTHVQHHG